jgi:GNAT superfamily N-acetyltransferase
MTDPRELDLVVRAAEIGDAAALAGLMGELGYETRASEMEMRMEFIRKDPRYQTFVAVHQGEVCGMIGTICGYSYERNEMGGRILALSVTEKMRGGGVGRRLIAAAENDFAARNIRNVAVNTRFEREKAHQFYDALGYTRNGFRFVKTLAGSAD